MAEEIKVLQARIDMLEQELAMYRAQTALLAADLEIHVGHQIATPTDISAVREHLTACIEALGRDVHLARRRAVDSGRMLVDAVGVLGNAIEARDSYTRGHTERVTRLAMALSRRLGWSEERLEECRIGGLLHDVGKIGIPDSILLKPGRLSPEEYDIMKRHPRAGAQILAPIGQLSFAMPYVLCHHERWDGKGYPDGLVGYAIPLEGRVLAIADAFDAMTSDRAYRKGMDSETAMGEMVRCSASQFDPELVELFQELYREGVIKEVLDRPHTFDYAP